MAQFLNKDSGLGWDTGPAGAVPWQMVPMGGARGIKLIGGADLQIRCRPANIASGAPDGLTYTETALTGAAHREIWLQGRNKGEYVVEAFKPESGVVVAMLGAGVFPLRMVKVAYYTLPGARKWDIKRVNDVAHNILFSPGEREGGVAGQLGQRVWLLGQAGRENQHRGRQAAGRTAGLRRRPRGGPEGLLRLDHPVGAGRQGHERHHLSWPNCSR